MRERPAPGERPTARLPAPDDPAGVTTSPRPQTRGEEIANSVTHGLGLVAAVAMAPVLVLTAARNGGTARIVAAATFAATLVLLYLASTLYHAMPARIKDPFRRLDHASIYILIAGTYTPVTLVTLRGAWGWSLFGVSWGLAALGVVLKAAYGAHLRPRLSTSLYVAMGWAAIIAIGPLLRQLPPGAFAWLLGGGLAYTGGVAFYVLDRRYRYAHAVWHLFVLAGSACHAWAIHSYVL